MLPGSPPRLSRLEELALEAGVDPDWLRAYIRREMRAHFQAVEHRRLAALDASGAAQQERIDPTLLRAN